MDSLSRPDLEIYLLVETDSAKVFVAFQGPLGFGILDLCGRSGGAEGAAGSKLREALCNGNE